MAVGRRIDPSGLLMIIIGEVGWRGGLARGDGLFDHTFGHDLRRGHTCLG